MHRFKIAVKYFFISLLCIVLAPYLFTKLYTFENPIPFHGNKWANPYQNLPNSFIKANFHAHSKLLMGIMHGENSISQIKDRYKKLGYTFASISNYMTISSDSTQGINSISSYEHGVNIFKTHQLSLGGNGVTYLEFPLWQSQSQKQQIIHEISKAGGLVVLAHPNFMHGYSFENLKYLTGYNFIEVFSNYANALNEWDAALSSGRLSWVMANDDTHDIDKQGTGLNYSQVYSIQKKPLGIINALKEGKNAAAHSNNSNFNIVIDAIKVVGDSLVYSFNGKIKQINIVADGIYIDTLNTSKGSISLKNIKNYIRMEAESDDGKLITNPIVRSVDGSAPLCSLIKPKVNQNQTLLFRIIVFPILIIILFRKYILKLFFR